MGAIIPTIPSENVLKRVAKYWKELFFLILISSNFFLFSKYDNARDQLDKEKDAFKEHVLQSGKEANNMTQKLIEKNQETYDLIYLMSKLYENRFRDSTGGSFAYPTNSSKWYKRP